MMTRLNANLNSDSEIGLQFDQNDILIKISLFLIKIRSFMNEIGQFLIKKGPFSIQCQKLVIN